jgi:hypothetical protein
MPHHTVTETECLPDEWKPADAGPLGNILILPRFRGRSDYAAAAVTCARNSNSTGLM